MRKSWGSGTVVIPAPREVDALMRRVRTGRVITLQELRRALAEQHGATIACPLTTGIFAWMAAHAACEAEAAGARRATPWWRTLKARGELNPKFPGGLAEQRARLEAEGCLVVQRGKKWFVAEYEQRLAKLPTGRAGT
jgi:DNA-binding GntR family transcriptional regulator